MQLFNIDIGVEVIIVKLNVSGKTKRFLQEMGFNKGTPITILSRSFGNMIIKVKDTRVGIGRELAKYIIVK